jgi:hypothetical protein
LKYGFIVELFEKMLNFPPPPLRRLILATRFGVLATQIDVSPSVRVAKSRRRAGEGGGVGLGSHLVGFSPNTGISFLAISPQFLDIWPFFLLVFSPIKTALLLILF